MEDNIQEKDDIAKVTSNNTIDNIKWDKVVFWCTVGLGVLTPLAFLRRYDILTVKIKFLKDRSLLFSECLDFYMGKLIYYIQRRCFTLQSQTSSICFSGFYII